MTSDRVRFDPQNPPPGVEVIGELPPGTPWWDADELLLPVNLIVVGPLFIPFVLLCMAAGLWLATGEIGWRFAASEPLAPILFALGCYVTLTLSSLVFLQRGIRIKQSLGVFPRTALPFGFQAKLDRIVNVLMYDHRQEFLGPSYPFAFSTRKYESVWAGAVLFMKSGVGDKPKRHSFQTSYLTASRGNLVALLTYRIAKAKGESPPPPDFG